MRLVARLLKDGRTMSTLSNSIISCGFCLRYPILHHYLPYVPFLWSGKVNADKEAVAALANIIMIRVAPVCFHPYISPSTTHSLVQGILKTTLVTFVFYHLHFIDTDNMDLGFIRWWYPPWVLVWSWISVDHCCAQRMMKNQRLFG